MSAHIVVSVETENEAKEVCTFQTECVFVLFKNGWENCQFKLSKEK